MKRFISGLIIGLIIATSTAVMANYDNIKLIVNGKTVQSDVQPIIVNDRTMVPVRVIAETLHANVNYNETTNTVEVATTDYATKMYNYKTIGDFAQATELIYVDLMMLSDGMASNDLSYKPIVEKDMKSVNDYYKTLCDAFLQDEYKVVLQNYQNSLSFYQHAYNSLLAFDTSNDAQDLQKFNDQLTAADSACKSGKKEADNWFNEYYNKSQQ